MSNVIIWHNPRCSKSRETLKLLKDKGVDPTVVTYLTEVPAESEIRRTAKLLGVNAVGMMRTKEKLFRELGLAKDDSDDKLFAAMAENPVLIERPVVFANAKARMGRPPESVLEIL